MLDSVTGGPDRGRLTGKWPIHRFRSSYLHYLWKMLSLLPLLVKKEEQGKRRWEKNSFSNIVHSRPSLGQHVCWKPAPRPALPPLCCPFPTHRNLPPIIQLLRKIMTDQSTPGPSGGTGYREALDWSDPITIRSLRVTQNGKWFSRLGIKGG